ncbi:MAG: bifunctional 4-hydroxy-2-oxoglutarate aldolase/2-dehydro-3-deoxy-phosphogluconate aldolase [Myxococcota bacterium]
MTSTLAAIREQGLIAVMDGTTPERVFEWAMAVSKGGIELLAIPVRLENVTEVVSDLDDVDDVNLVVGIAGVLQAEEVSIAVAAGGEFLISPVVDENIIEASKSRGLVTIVGATTPTEVHRAVNAGADLVSIHPVGALGKPEAYFDAMRRAFPDTPLIVSGGIDVELAPALLEAGAAAAIVDKGVFPDATEASALEVITMRAVALVEVCADVMGMPKRSSFTEIRASEILEFEDLEVLE